jgi:GntR family transcriptional regulator, gluconate operon transcriptional repressor
VPADSEAIARPARLSEIAAERLREQILRGRLKPGAALSQESLAREFGISRTPLRDALKMLAGDGLIQLDGSGSATVVDPSAQDAQDLLLIRAVIDSVAARRATGLAAAARTELGEILRPSLRELEVSAGSEDRYRFRVADSQFHVAILQHCGLEHLDRCYAFVHTTALSMYAVRAPSPGHLAEAFGQHQGIAAAIVAGDMELSARLAEQHVRHAYDYYYRDWPEARGRAGGR